jgi:hypothetical protein
MRMSGVWVFMNPSSVFESRKLREKDAADE